MAEDNKKILVIDDTKYETKLLTKYEKRQKWQKENPYEIKAYIPGIILSLFVKKGDAVRAGDRLLILEAMKMQNNVVSSVNGRIKSIHVKEGVNVPKNHLLIEIEP